VPPAVKKAYARVDYEIDDQTINYFKVGFEPQFHQLNPELGTQGLTLVSSQDRYKLTLVRSDDLMPSQNFAQWEACRDKYLQHINDPNFGTPAEELYVFPSEINTAYFETRMPGLLKRNWRKVQPEVVSLLEDREHFTLFFLAAAHGFVRSEYVEDEGAFWSFRLSQNSEPLYLTLPPGRKLEEMQTDMFQVLIAFLSGHDQRPGHQEVKTVDWKEALDAVLKREREMGRSESVAAYRHQEDGEDGIVKTILAQASRLQSDGKHSLAEIQRQNYHDLADLAKVVYLEAIQRCNNTLQDRPKAN
jgi:hypothetical protein